jgi:hypothetical protein
VHGHADAFEEVPAVVPATEHFVRLEVVENRRAALDDPEQDTIERRAFEYEEKRSAPLGSDPTGLTPTGVERTLRADD